MSPAPGGRRADPLVSWPRAEKHVTPTAAAAARSAVQLRFVSREEKQGLTDNEKDSSALIRLARDRLSHSSFVDLCQLREI